MEKDNHVPSLPSALEAEDTSGC